MKNIYHRLQVILVHVFWDCPHNERELGDALSDFRRKRTNLIKGIQDFVPVALTILADVPTGPKIPNLFLAAVFNPQS